MTEHHTHHDPLDLTRQKPHRHGVWRVLILLILAGYGAWLYRLGGNPFDLPEPNVAFNEDDAVSELEVEFMVLQRKQEQYTAQLREAGEEQARLREQIAALEEKLNQREDEAVPPETLAAIKTMTETLGALNKKISDIEQRHEHEKLSGQSRVAFLAGISAVEERLASGASYAKELGALRAQAAALKLPHDAALGTLSKWGENGIPTLNGLIRRFDEMAQLAVPVSIDESENSSVADTLRARLGHVISIRKIAADETDHSNEALIALADSALREGDVEKSAQYAKQLTTAPRTVMQPWINMAETYVAARRALAQLKEAATASAVTVAPIIPAAPPAEPAAEAEDTPEAPEAPSPAESE